MGLALKENELVTGKIESLTDGGDGVLRTEGGFVVFVPLTAPGDVVRARIVKAAKNCAYGVLESVVEPSQCRVTSDCPVFERCGGCALRHMTYESELEQKRGWVRDHLKRIGGFDIKVPPVVSSPKTEGYRNKAIYPAAAGKDGAPLFGFYARKSHDLVPALNCLLQPELFSKILAAVRFFAVEAKLSVYDEKTHSGLLRAVYIRMAETTGRTVVCVVVNGDRLPQAEKLCSLLSTQFPQVGGVVLNMNCERTNVVLGRRWKTLWGDERLTDTLCGVELEISPASFYQVNHGAAQLLYRQAADFAGLTGGETLLDLYCGAGSIGLSMAKSVGKLIGVEIVPAAVENARRNAERNGVSNAEFICADAGKAAALLAERGVRPDVVVMDPPRKGADADTLTAVVTMEPERIVMVSCNTATMARDCRALVDMGYALSAVQPVDMFPRTANVEAVCLLSKLRAERHI